MKLLRQIYGVAAGTPRYRRLKAFQLYATLRRQHRGNNRPAMTQSQRNRIASSQRPQKLAAISQPPPPAAAASKEIAAEVESDYSSDESQSQSSSSMQSQSLTEDYSLRLSSQDYLIFIPCQKRMTFKGEFQMTVLLGEIAVNGLTICAKSSLTDSTKLPLHKVSSLPKNSLLSFESTASTPTSFSTVNESNILQLINHNIISISSKGDCDKLIDGICEHIQQITATFHEHKFVNIIYVHSATLSNSSHHQNSINSHRHNHKQQNVVHPPFEILEVVSANSASSTPTIQWTQTQASVVDRAISRFQAPTQQSKCLLICGQKNSGKSMFSLYASNRLLNSYDRICILDTDLGQSLFHFPATVNLFSISRKDIPLTNLTHISFIKPIVSVFVGEYSPQQFIQQYIAAIRKCFKFYEEFFSNCPIVLNTHGYITNIGELLLYEIQDIVEPAVVALLSKNEHLLSHLQSPISRQSRLSITQKHKDTLTTRCETFDASNSDFDANQVKVNEAKRHRKDEMIFQYLTNQAKFDTNTYPYQYLFQSQYGQLCLQKPFEVPVSALSFMLLDTHETIRNTGAEVAKHFNCAIVALFDSSFTWNNSTANCIGFALVRDVNVKAGTMEIITSNSIINDLARVAVVLKSSEVALSKYFYLHHQHVYQEIAELTYDINADFSAPRVLDVPYLLPKSCGLGNISFRSRVSSRK